MIPNNFKYIHTHTQFSQSEDMVCMSSVCCN